MAYWPDEVELVELIDLLSQTTLSGIFYGFSIILGSICIWKQLKELQSKRFSVQHSILLLLHSLLLVVFACIFLVANNWLALSAYLKHNHTLGEPVLYEATLVTPNMLNIVSQLGISSLVAGLEIWRISVIWFASPYRIPVIVFFTICYFTFIGLEITEIIYASPLYCITSIKEPKEMIADARTTHVAYLLSTIKAFPNFKSYKTLGQDFTPSKLDWTLRVVGDDNVCPGAPGAGNAGRGFDGLDVPRPPQPLFLLL
ncbi:hypothetical protein NP233_g11848 [Leucocoprinus birnbaumii]|uniref:Uncharacterized protein n=1 Tax=Leucocoprinus birnbaumii TaxID=56174 RepID=A0AAD5YJZ8_9AGAR|nr:hypothetical protein NP233_g11848 [Leucocoprinus birnbaumii]